MLNQSIIELKDLTKRYGNTCAVDHLSLTINKGEVFGLLGPNGAGKSTTILMMLGLSEPTKGTIKVCGYDSTREPIKVKQKVGYLPDNVGFYEDRTGLENVMYTALLNGIPQNEAKDQSMLLLRQVGLQEAMHKKAGTYSRGMKQRLGLADVLIKSPDVIVLDEPTLGIDPKGVQELLLLIKRLSKEQGITVLLSSHHLHQVQQICDRVGLFVEGKLLACGKVEELAHELFSDKGISIFVKASGIKENTLQRLRELNYVFSAEWVDTDLIEVKSEADVAADVSRCLVEAGASLHELKTKRYGLDEIYHQYFQGGAGHEVIIP